MQELGDSKCFWERVLNVCHLGIKTLPDQNGWPIVGSIKSGLGGRSRQLVCEVDDLWRAAA